MTGEDAPTALLAEEIIRRMPPYRDDMPAGGRRLLVFSDSRQRAAYFTPYLTRTTAEPSYIQPLLETARKIQASRNSPGTVVEVIDRGHAAMLQHPWVVARHTDDEGFDRYSVVPTAQINPQERRELRHELALTLYEHLSASHTQRTKIGGLMLGAGAVEFTPAELDAARRAAPLLFPSEQVGVDAIHRLLMYLVRRGAVEYVPDTVTRTHIIGAGPTLVTVHRNPEPARVGSRYRVRWNPFEATKSRGLAISRSYTAATVRQVLGQTGDASDTRVAETLDQLWGWLIADQRILRQVEPGEYQLPASRILLVVDGQWYKCRRCGTPTIHQMTGVCQIPRCGGTLAPVDSASREAQLTSSHRAYRYLRDPMPLVVREHTAQLTLERGREYQDEFKQSKANVLSSSTTFEMGVDVGQLQAVLLRNVPPTPANYIQRAGRAGRRRQGVAHAVTYARSVPHDQHYYFRPRDIVVGRVPVPVIYTANTRLTQRHVNSFLLGRFLRDHLNRFENDSLRIGEFFPESETGEQAPADLFGPWCQHNQAKLAAELSHIIPADCPLDPARAIEAAATTLFSRDPQSGRDTAYIRGFILPLKSYQNQYEELAAEEAEAKRVRQLQKAKALTHAMWRVQRLQEQLKEVYLIDSLAEQCWLPSYAFPQDVIKLKVRQELVKTNMRLERDRELGISEYSPGSQVIADGKLFESVGVDLEKREPDLMYFRISRQTRQIVIGHSAQEVKANTRDMPPTAMPWPFLEPAGFTTKHDAPALEPNLFRLKPPSNTEVFLLDGAPESEFAEHPCLRGAITAIRPNAKLFRANLGKKGQGFMICLSCGLAVDDAAAPRAGHITPWGSTCRGRFEKVALAHIFTTDVLQVRFPGYPAPAVTDAPFWFTLATALANTACRKLYIDPADLDSTYRSQSGTNACGELVLYDRVPGGAGHVDRIRNHLPDLLRETLQLLSHCSNQDCDQDAACYACLRSHRNQFQWSNLKRSAPLPWLQSLCAAIS
ncbi:DUF1998 domain-containing protein [Fontivita pretiosa]|uniref:DUF1998 domain-containing protein n=1 Tax=Fontivita pretiosa TaxID=2989684 RepID=UPI003D174DBF